MLVDTCSKVTIIGTIETKPTKEIINVQGVMGRQTPAFGKIDKITTGDKKLLITVMLVSGYDMIGIKEIEQIFPEWWENKIKYIF